MLAETWWVITEAAPWILGGTVLAGLLKSWMRPSALRQWLAQPDWQSVARATLVGVPLPLCSCSVLPVAMELRRSGAGRGATGAFLVSTPQSGVDSIFLTIGMMNPLFAGVRLFVTFLTGLITGLMLNLLDRRGGESVPGKVDGEDSCGKGGCCGNDPLPREDERPGLWGGQTYAFGNLLPSMAIYYVLGFLATGLALAILPANVLEAWLGGGIVGMLAVCVVGVLVYLCASAATPLAAGLMAKGMSPGTALVLLLAGPATSLASMLAVRAMIGGRGLVVYLACIIGCAIGAGLLIDQLALGLFPGLAVAAIGGEEHAAGWVGHLTGLILVLILVPALLADVVKRIRRMSAR
ncbi:MAG: permease [Candidatus Sumerlaeia bacterium]|nr:permease [Candidatus Sumerlaeia bacterium]